MVSAIDEHLGIAVVDDDAIFREATCAMLSCGSGYVSFPAASRDDLFAVLEQQRIDCIVLDYDLGDDTGLSIKTRLDQFMTEPPPIIMLTGDGRESTVIKAFRMGVSDYLPKHNLQPNALVSTIARVVDSERERLLKGAEYKRLTEAASIDLVSGLLSRVNLDGRLRQLQAMPLHARRSYAVIVIELRDFSFIVENVGIKAGDTVLRAFAKQLRTAVRSEDICGRYAEGTFLVIADVKADVGLLRAMGQRFADNQHMMLELSAAKLVLKANVAGALLDVDEGTDGGDPSRLLNPVFNTLSEAKAEGEACRIAGLDSQGLSADATILGAAVPIGRLAQPAADLLRTGDRRDEPRHRVFKRGIVHQLGTQSTFDCTVRNLSANGAGLRLDTAFAVPATFDLEIQGTGTRRRAAVRWQIGTDFGVLFSPS